MVPRLEDPPLDEEHAQLQQLIDAFAAGGLAQAPVRLEALRAHAALHFSGEDDDLRAMKGGGRTGRWRNANWLHGGTATTPIGA